VLELGGDLDLAEKPVGAESGGELGPEHLDGHPPVVPGVHGQVNSGHATLANEALHSVPLLECGP